MMDSFPLCLFNFLLLIFGCSAQELLPPSQTQALLRIQQLLEHPPALDGWNNRTDFCNFPKTGAISVSCTHNNASITELVIVGVEHTHLSPGFSIDRLFATLSIFTVITNLSLVSLGIWGNLPIFNTSLRSLRNLNLSSNMLYGNIPNEITEFRRLETLDLASNFLTGSVPQLTGLDALRQLHLASNRLGPDFPVVGANLVYLNISENNLIDILPECLRNMTNLQLLDASHNNLFGSIPSFLFALPSVEHLGLNGNSLTGDVPDSADQNCNKNLKFVNISDNKLVGGEHQPTCLTSISFLYSWNCLSWGNTSSQYPSSYCKATKTAAAAKAATATPPSPPPPLEKSRKKVASLVLGVIGGIIGCAILVTLVLMLVFENNLIRKMIDHHKQVIATARPIPAATTTSIQMSPEVRMGGLGFTIPYRVFDIKELEESTNNFDSSNLLEETPQFQMYKGQIQDGSAVIIKRIRSIQKNSNQLDALSKLRHHHLVSILGHCVVEGKKNHFGTTTSLYLVFEHITNGTLRAHLTEMLKWSERVNAVIGIARGLQFLHAVTTPGICGNDLKIDNILLDQTLTTKIHNYNLPIDLRSKKEVIIESLMTALNRKKKKKKKKNGNNWYMKNGVEYDIFQLGLILLQVITGESVSSESQLEAMKDQMQRIVAENAAYLCEFTDSAIQDSCSYDSVNVVVEVALKCLSNDITKRPSLDDVVWNLKYSAQVQEEERASRDDSGFVEIDVF